MLNNFCLVNELMNERMYILRYTEICYKLLGLQIISYFATTIPLMLKVLFIKTNKIPFTLLYVGIRVIVTFFTAYLGLQLKEKYKYILINQRYELLQVYLNCSLRSI